MCFFLGKNIWFIVLSTLPIYVFTTPEFFLDVRSSDGATMSTVGRGIPFQVIVTMRNCSGQPQIDIDQSIFSLFQRVSVQTRIINGNSSISYVYSARIDNDPGIYEIGPARVHISGSLYETNTCSIEVGTQEKKVGAHFIMDISCEHDVIYIGQETHIHVKIYSAISLPDVESLHVPTVDGVCIGDMREVSSGTEYIDKVKYRYREYVASLSVEKVGTFLIPSYSADIRDDQVRRSGFGLFFSAIAPTKQIHSNVLHIEGRVLPSGNKQSTLVGTYTHASVSIEPIIVQIGQATRYRIILHGTGNALKIKAPLLSGIPTSCKYYDSSPVQLTQKDTAFEYIIQPRQAGTWEIPSQEIIYFDPVKEDYYALHTDSIVITALATSHEKESLSYDNDAHISQDDICVQTSQQFHPDLCANDPSITYNIRIPWFWYWCIIIGIFLIWCVWFLTVVILMMYKKNQTVYRSHFAFYKARIAINMSEKKKQADLYHIFIILFAEWFMVDMSSITEYFIQKQLMERGILSEDGIESWNHFWYKIVHGKYGIQYDHTVDKTIYTEARLWVNAFSKVGKR